MPGNHTSSIAPEKTKSAGTQKKYSSFPQGDSTLDQGLALLRKCVHEHPEASALWCLGIGFVLGWKLKPW